MAIKLAKKEKFYMAWMRYLAAVSKHYPKVFSPLDEARHGFTPFAKEWLTRYELEMGGERSSKPPTLEIVLEDFVKSSKNIVSWSKSLKIPTYDPHSKKPEPWVRDEDRHKQKSKGAIAGETQAKKIYEEMWNEREKFYETLAATLIGASISVDCQFTREELTRGFEVQEVLQRETEAFTALHGNEQAALFAGVPSQKTNLEDATQMGKAPCVDWQAIMEKLTDFGYLLDRVKGLEPSVYIYPKVKVDIRIDENLDLPKYEPPVYYSWMTPAQYTTAQIDYKKNMLSLFSELQAWGDLRGRGENTKIDKYWALADKTFGGYEPKEIYDRQHPQDAGGTSGVVRKANKVSAAISDLNNTLNLDTKPPGRPPKKAARP